MKPETLLRASRLIKTGEAIELGRVLSSDMPLFAGRQFNIHTKRTNGPLGSNKRYSNEELVVAEMGQVGTQFDMFSHQGLDGRLYNCVAIADASTRTGFAKLGVEKVGLLFTRGVLLDIAAEKGVAMLPASHEISVAEIQAALARAKLTLQPGDAVLVHTGWGQLWGTDNARYAGNSPGIGVAAAEWLARQDVMLIGGDTAPVEISPNPDPQLNLPVHQIALVVNGIFLLENLKLDELAAKRATEFALVLQPLKLKGGTGSTVAPVAIR
jgi:kynurenine formamidase